MTFSAAEFATKGDFVSPPNGMRNVKSFFLMDLASGSPRFKNGISTAVHTSGKHMLEDQVTAVTNCRASLW